MNILKSKSPSTQRYGMTYVIPLKYVTKEELENIYPRARTNSEAYIHDLIRMYGGIND